MTVSNTTTPRVKYAGNGVTTTFAISFAFDLDGDLIVVDHVVDATGAVTRWTLGSEYTVVSTDVEATAGADIATGEFLVISRATPVTQGTDFVQNRAYSADTMEQRLDLLTLMVGELQEDVNRCARVAVSNIGDPTMVIPDAVDNTVLGFDASGDLEAQAGLSAYGVTTFIATLLDDADAEEARTTLAAVGVLEVDTTDNGFTGDTNAHDLGSQVFAANELGTDGVVRIEVSGDVVNVGGGNKTIDIVFGATGSETTLMTLTIGAATTPFRVMCVIALDGAHNAQEVGGEMGYFGVYTPAQGSEAIATNVETTLKAVATLADATDTVNSNLTIITRLK